MALDLKPVHLEQTIEVGDESGYRYTITAVKDDEWGWQASVAMSSFGLTSAEAAVKHLRYAAENFVRLLADEPKVVNQTADYAEDNNGYAVSGKKLVTLVIKSCDDVPENVCDEHKECDTCPYRHLPLFSQDT